MLNEMPVNTPKSEHLLRVLWPFLLLDSQSCLHISYLLKIFLFKEKLLRSIYHASWTLLSLMWGKLRKLTGRFDLPQEILAALKILTHINRRISRRLMNFRYSKFFWQQHLFYIAVLCDYVRMRHFGFMSQKKWNSLRDAVSCPGRNETVTLWRGVMSQKKWNCHFVTRCHVPEEMKLSLHDAVPCPRRNETATSWRGVMSQKKWNGHFVTPCHVPEEMKWSLRDAVSCTRRN